MGLETGARLVPWSWDHMPRSSNRTGFTPPKRGMQVRVLLGAPFKTN